LVAEAGEDGRDDFFQVAGDFLRRISANMSAISSVYQAYRSQCYRSGCQPYKTAIPGVWVVDGIRILVAELMDNLRYPVVVLGI